VNRQDTDDYRHIFLHDVPMIDTRAPVEFGRGAFEHAVSLPLMTDEERHLVGTRYKTAGQQEAIDLGRELVDQAAQRERTGQWVEFARAHPGGYLYCFRGGLRSRISQQWMTEAGTPYPYVRGGYKAMRRFLLGELEHRGGETPLILISGRTGTGKTWLLRRIVRSLDLEGLANHRGSSFGPMAEPQPTPIDFENRLAVRLLKLTCEDRESPVFVEGEGRLVGSLTVPDALWANMQRSPTLVLEADMDRRVEIGLADYVVDLLARIRRSQPGDAGFECFAERHRQSLYRIRRRLGLERHAEAAAMLEAALSAHRESGDLEGYRPFIRMLLERYYDPMYDYQLSLRPGKVLARGDEDQLLHWLSRQGVGLG
jgi:tRNA 2-selenouridine synthase